MKIKALISILSLIGVFLNTSLALPSTTWKVLSYRGTITINQDTIRKHMTFSDQDTIVFSNTYDAIFVVELKEEKITRLIHPEQFTPDSTEAITCLPDICIPKWVDAGILIEDRKSKDMDEQGNPNITITKEYWVDGYGRVTYIRNKGNYLHMQGHSTHSITKQGPKKEKKSNQKSSTTKDYFGNLFKRKQN